MSPDSPRNRVFVIQFRADAEPGQGRWFGRVEHVESGRSARFASSEAMREFFSRLLREEEEDTPQLPGSSETECHRENHHDSEGENK
jgi:hypothetical protein